MTPMEACASLKLGMDLHAVWCKEPGCVALSPEAKEALLTLSAAELVAAGLDEWANVGTGRERRCEIHRGPFVDREKNPRCKGEIGHRGACWFDPAGERIVAAAIRREGVVYTAPHHHQAIHYVALLTGEPFKGEQGFVTSANRFVGRIEAAEIAHAAGQYTAFPAEALFSERLWEVTDYQLARLSPPAQPVASVERERALVEAARPYLGAKHGWLPGVGSVRSVGVTEREHRALWDAVAAYGPIDPGAVAPAPASVSEEK